jgi:hypothetical protein
VSANLPPARAPKNKPKVLALKNLPSCSGVGLNSGTIPAAATPAACRSKPSHNATSTQQTMVTVAVFDALLELFIRLPLIRARIIDSRSIVVKAEPPRAGDRRGYRGSAGSGSGSCSCRWWAARNGLSAETYSASRRFGLCLR